MLPRFSILVPSFQMQTHGPFTWRFKGSQFNSRRDQLFYFFLSYFFFFFYSFLLHNIWLFYEKIPYISFFFLKKRKTTIRGWDHLTLRGAPGCEDLRKKILQSLLNREKHCPVRNKVLQKPIIQLSSPPPSLKVKWSKLISSCMDFEPHIKKVRLSSHSTFFLQKIQRKLISGCSWRCSWKNFSFQFWSCQTQYNALVLLVLLVIPYCLIGNIWEIRG